MTRFVRGGCIALLLATFGCRPALADQLEFSFDYDMAKAVSHAIRARDMTPKTDAAIRALPAAAGMIKKMRLKDGDSLTAYLHRLSNNEKAIAAAALVADELDRQDGGKYALLGAEVTRQLKPYVPPRFAARLKVYFIFGVDSEGFAFGEDPYNVYVNLARFSTASAQELAETVAHELFHAVQSGIMAPAPDVTAPLPAQAAGAVWLNRLMYDLFQEGSAELFTHPVANRPESAHSRRARNRIERNMSRMKSIVDLFETAGLRLALAPPQNEDGYNRVYGFLFYTEFDEPAYDLGWVMANALVAKDGKMAIAGLFKEPPKRFVLRYQDIAQGDPKLPKFSDEFMRMVRALPE